MRDVLLAPGRVANGLLDLAFPAVCAGCGREGQPLCPRCGSVLDVRADVPGGTPIGLPSETPAPLLQLEWCAPFSATIRRALHALKYAAETRLAEPLGLAVARRWRRAGVGAELIVHVPVHAERARQRGYDQAALIATAAGRGLGMPTMAALERRRATRPQFELGHDLRADNVRGAFCVRGPPAARVLRGRWVLLVDDVVTTGATLAACADALLEAGAFGVSAVTVARER